MQERMLCPNCKTKVLLSDEKCPKCDYEIKNFIQSTTLWGLIGFLFITLGLIISVLYSAVDYIGVGFIVGTPPILIYYRNRQRIEKLTLKKRR